MFTGKQETSSALAEFAPMSSAESCSQTLNQESKNMLKMSDEELLPPLDSIICGDNVETMESWKCNSIDLVVTSPPYDDLRGYGGNLDWNFEKVAKNLSRIIKPGGVIVWVVSDQTKNGSESLSSMRQAIYFHDECGLLLHDTMIYQKNAIPKNHNRYEQEWEYMFVFSKGKPKTFNPIRVKCKYPEKEGSRYKGKYSVTKEKSRAARSGKERNPTKEEKIDSNVWNISAGKGHSTLDDFAYQHPAIFPEKLATRHIHSWSNPGDLVLDPFAGSGTTLKCAKELNRRYVGIEINSEYVKICQKRISQEILKLY